MTQLRTRPVKKKVLLCIDDDKSGLLIRQIFLQSHGYDVLIASNVRDGLAMFEREKVDAVVLDYYLPDMNGDVLAEELKTRRPDLPILMLSAFVIPPEEATANTDAYIVKGDAPKRLLVAIDQLLKKAA